MKISIIGAGNIGGALTHRFTDLGYDVSVANHSGPDSLAELTTATGAYAASLDEVATGADVVVLAIPEKAIPNLKGKLAGAHKGAVIIDTCNYYPARDGSIKDIEQGVPSSQWVSDQLDCDALGYSVVKAFNNAQAQYLADPSQAEAAVKAKTGNTAQLCYPVAGNNALAKQTVEELVTRLGYDYVDAGTLQDSWRQEPGTAVYGTSLDASATKDALASTSK